MNKLGCHWWWMISSEISFTETCFMHPSEETKYKTRTRQAKNINASLVNKYVGPKSYIPYVNKALSFMHYHRVW